MATIQAKKPKGHKYWYIVESRRFNGKPGSIVLEYLGKADDLYHISDSYCEKKVVKNR